MKEFSDKEKQAIVKFREKLTDLKLDDDKSSDGYLLRWLKARDMNVDKSDAMLRKSLKWRDENNIDKILEWKAPEIYSQLYPIEFCGHDKYGCPIVVIPLRFFDMRKFWKIDKDEYVRFGVQNMERVLSAMKVNSTLQRPVTEFVAIYDMEGLDMRAFMNKQHLLFFQESTARVEEHYPGPYIRKAYCLYTPKVFSMIFSMVKYVVPKRTIERYEIHGCNRDKWAHKLLEHISADQLPEKFGGTNTEFEKSAFANCRVPTGSHDEEEEEGADGFVKAVVSARKKLQLDVDVDAANSLFSWIFKTESLDIGFSVLHGNEEVVPYQRVPSGNERQKNSIICTNAGRYTVVFDNSYSKLRDKILHYKIEVSNAAAESN